MKRTASTARGTTSTVLGILGETGGLLLQLLLVWVGVELVFSDTPDDATGNLLIWCIVATVYLLVTIVGLQLVVWLDQPDPPVVRLIIANRLTRVLSSVLTFGASLLGLREAFELIISIGTKSHDALLEIAAVWAMLLSWALFNWGYARIYYGRYHRASEPPLVFPGTSEPRLTDFAYLAFTNATTFGVSDVLVTSPRLRWTIVWHSTFAFFFNSVIIVLSINVVTDAGFFKNLLGS